MCGVDLKKGSKPRMSYLYDPRIDPNLADADGNTGLNYAWNKRHESVVKLLLERPVRVNVAAGKPLAKAGSKASTNLYVQEAASDHGHHGGGYGGNDSGEGYHGGYDGGGDYSSGGGDGGYSGE
ncbi:hypothetical protein DFJ74DRAFT_710170 [Hyaloraphidium curvatum]|nr:hypothetical protein DFJ74DRAFT_710170 [Hyaloraphidium curvatum]